MLPLAGQLRIVVKCLVSQRRHHLTRITFGNDTVARRREKRDFSSTASAKASEDPENVFSQLQSTPIMRKLADKPKALQALSDLAQVIKEADIVLTPDTRPSTMQMFKLASNPKFRESAKRVVEELRNAGIEINSENAFELFGLKPPS